MADYVSSLNGSQMDQALIDMAEHNSEAWAVGERNGIPVGSDDVTYQNNAQYYASQAQSIAPASVTEAVRWDIAQTALTDANKAQARSNIDAGKNGAWSNRNLLDNWYFVGGGSQLGDETFPINQRGLTNYSGDGSCTIDRWMIETGMTLALESGGVRITAAYLYTGFTIDIPSYKLQNGETYTFSIEVDGTIHSATFVANNDGNWANILFGTDWYTPYRYVSNVWQFKALNVSDNTSFNHLVSRVKLEKGTVSTLANDAPPDFGEELQKCQRYLWVKTFPANTQIGVGSCIDATTVVANIVTPVAMRANVIATFTANVLLLGEGTLAVASAVIGIGAYDNNIRIILSSAGLTAYKLYSFFTSTETTMTISAEI